MTDTVSGLVAFLETGDLPPDLFAPDVVTDFNVPSWRFALRGPQALAAQRHEAGAGPWKIVVEQVRPTDDGYAIELTHEHGGEYYRTLSLITEADGRIMRFVHYCTGNSVQARSR